MFGREEINRNVLTKVLAHSRDLTTGFNSYDLL